MLVYILMSNVFVKLMVLIFISGGGLAIVNVQASTVNLGWEKNYPGIR